MSKKIVKVDRSNETQGKQLFLPTELDFTFQQLLNSYIKNGLIEKIGAIPFSIWIIIRAYATVSGKDAGKSFVSYGQIQKISGFSITSIRKSVTKLEDEGLIKVFEEDKARGSSSKRYYTVEFIVSESDSSKKIEIPYVPESAADTRRQVQRWVETATASKLPENVFVWQDNRRIDININIQTKEAMAELIGQWKSMSATDRESFSKSFKDMPWKKYLPVDDKEESSEG